MTSSLHSTLQHDIKDAMRAKDALRLGTLRLLSAAIKQQEVDARIQLDDNAILALITKMIKQRQDSITQYTKGNRSDLAAQEQAEMDILQSYMPSALTESEIEDAISQAFNQINPQNPQDMGKVMAILKLSLTGRADIADVSKRVKIRLAQI
jgi:uncharacterized protein